VRDFACGQTYTRGEIRQALGGDLSSSLPHRDGRVVCGCFRPDLNPDAPDVILSGRGPGIERGRESSRRSVSSYLSDGVPFVPSDEPPDARTGAVPIGSLGRESLQLGLPASEGRLQLTQHFP